MPNWVNNTLTIQGEIAVAAAIAGTQLVITRVSVGSGVASGTLSARIALVTPVMNLTPVPPQVTANNLAPGEVIVMATLDSANVGATFSLTEMGVWGKSGSGGEVLIAYCQASPTYDSIATGSGSNRLQINEQIPIVVGVGASVSITVQAGNPVFVPPVVAGAGIVVTAPTNSSGQVLEWIVATPTITQSTTLNVFNGAPDIAPNFTSIQNAMNYLSSFSIPSNVFISISVAAGAYAETVTTQITHVNASQIYISGAKNPDLSFTSANIIGGSPGNWTMQLSGCPSTANCIVGNWLIVWNMGGNTSWTEVIACGFFPIRAVTATTVNVTVPYRGTFATLGGANGNFTPITTFIIAYQGTLGCSGVNITNGLGLFAYIGIIPDQVPPGFTSAHGIITRGTATIDHCGVYAFQGSTGTNTGFWTGGPGAVSYTFCASLQCNMGFTAGGAGAFSALTWCASTHHTAAGLWAEAGGTFVTNPQYYAGDWYNALCWIGGNGTDGMLISDSSLVVQQGAYHVDGTLVGGQWYIAYNLQWGLVLSNQSRTASSFGSANFVTNLNTAFNTAGDIIVQALSVCNCGRGGTANLSQAVGILTAGGLINVV